MGTCINNLERYQALVEELIDIELISGKDSKRLEVLGKTEGWIQVFACSLFNYGIVLELHH
jgi:hypothetical protein